MKPSRFRLLALAILAAAVAVQLGLMAFLGERAYGDVLKAINFGYLLDLGATTMMMTCLVFSAPLIATWLMRRAGRLAPRARRAAAVALVLGYPAAATAVTALHLHRDTYEVRLLETPAEAARMFRYNPPLEPVPPRRLPAEGGGE